MPNEPTKKIALALNNTPSAGPLPGTEPRANLVGWGRNLKLRAGLFLVAAGILWGALGPSFASRTSSTVTIDGVVFKVQVADDEEEQARGLSGTANLASDEGMLFEFAADLYWPFWMKDMNYPIDILWMDSGRRVVYIEQNVSPSTYPQVFTPDTSARYALEIPAGSVAKYGLEKGQTANFQLKP